MNALETKDLTKIIRKRTILEHVTVQIQSGERIGIIGNNGSGKSVFFKMISGIMLPTSGEIKVFEKKVDAEHFPDSYGCLIEQPGLLGQYSGKENLKLLAGIRNGCTEEEIDALMRRFELDPKDKKPVRTYSVGMKQKLGIIQAIMEKPKFLVLDEPMNNLDLHSIQIAMDLVREMQSDRQITTLISGHHLEDIEPLCDTYYRVENGRIERI